MHESLLALPDTLDNLKNEIAKLCETWFNKGFPNKDKLNANVLIYLLRKTVLPSGIVSEKEHTVQPTSVLAKASV